MDALVNHILALSERAFAIQQALTAIPAIGPENGGQGEQAKALLIKDFLAACGVADILEVNSPDTRVECGFRPNLVARIHGKSPRTLWLFGHLDVVPPGLGWATDPWKVLRQGDLIYGRGVEDNQQAITSMILLAESLHELKITPALSLGLVFMADEECGSRHGLEWILKQVPELFGKNDLYIVPDGGSCDGTAIEVAEKAQCWLKFVVKGRQCHASAPQNGCNAFVAASRLVVAFADFDKEFPERNELFSPPYSTFVPTRHEDNHVACNILPGEDVFYLDCRLLPETGQDALMAKIGRISGDIAAFTDAQIDMEIVQAHAATEIDPQSEVVEKLMAAIVAVYNVKARPCGIGGATVAALLREAGLPAAVWSCLLNTCHQPNECSSLLAACRDAAVFAHILQSA